MERKFAFFDFDGTLIPGDSIVPLVFYARRNGFKGFLWEGIKAAIAFRLGKCSAEKSKERALGFLQGRTVAEMDSFARTFCRKKLIPRLRKKGLAEMERLRAEGYSIWLVSASPAFYLEPLREFLPIERIVATRFAVDSSGVYTGALFGENCRGYQKPLRLAEMLSSLGQEVAYDSSRAYGDSSGDAPMLNLCGIKVCVNASHGLRKLMKGDHAASFVRW